MAVLQRLLSERSRYFNMGSGDDVQIWDSEDTDKPKNSEGMLDE